jgi:hypothetical protein
VEEWLMSQETSVVCLYPSIDGAEDAVRRLGQAGFPIRQVSIITKDLCNEKKVHGFVTSGDLARSSARSGAWAGGIFGMLVGAAFVWLPGFGPLLVAGSLTTALLGGLEGAVAGAGMAGVLGWLGSLGISGRHIVKYEQGLKAGKSLVVAHGSVEEVTRAEAILAATSAAEVNLHSRPTRAGNEAALMLGDIRA